MESVPTFGCVYSRKNEEYLKKPYKIELIPDMEECGYVVSCPELPGNLKSECLKACINSWLSILKKRGLV